MGVTQQPRWLISLAEIAALAEVKRPVATNWVRRHADFPQPVSRDGGRPRFDGRQVVAWLVGTGHGNADRRRLQAELALHTLASWRDYLPARVLVDALTALVCLRRQLDAPLSDSSWDSILEKAARVDFEDAYLLAELRAVPTPETLGTALATLADELVEAAYTPAEAFEWVLEARPRLDAGDLMADMPSPLLADALARLSGIGHLGEGAIVATPYARSGDLLVALHTHAAPEAGHSYLAADPDPSFVRLVRRRMFVRDVYDFQLGVTEGSDLVTDDWGDPDVLLCALPYEPGESRTALAVLERIQALTDLLGPGRTAIILGPADVLTGPLPSYGDADLLRRWFLTDRLLKVVARLPGGAFPYRPGYRTAIWVLTRTPKSERAGVVLLKDLSSRPLDEHTLNALVEDVQIFRSAGWQPDDRHAPRHGVILPMKVLADRPGTAFTPQHRPHESRYTRVVRERPVLISELEVRLGELIERTRRDHIDRPALRTRAALRPEDRPVRRTTVGRMLQERRLRRLPGHRIAPEHLTPDGDHPVLTPEEVIGAAPVGGRRIDRLVFAAEYEYGKLTQPGDVVVTAAPEFGAYVDEDGLSVVAYPARILRVRPEAERPIRPRVLAALLRAAGAEHRRAAGAVHASRRIEDLLIPDLAPDEAERYDTLLADIERRGALLRAQTAALDELARLIAAGLTDGTLTILPAP
jgi:Type I restriction-modification system methyltransferase subunit